jgi:hypothetical protein
MLDEPRVLPRRVNQCRCHLLPENNEIIREPETPLARMLIRFVSASLSTTKNGLRTAELSVMVQFCLSTQEAQDMATREDPL